MLAIATSRLDYSNSSLAYLQDNDINYLQNVQNSAARLVTLTPRWDSISHILKTTFITCMQLLFINVFMVKLQYIQWTAQILQIIEKPEIF